MLKIQDFRQLKGNPGIFFYNWKYGSEERPYTQGQGPETIEGRRVMKLLSRGIGLEGFMISGARLKSEPLKLLMFVSEF
jgi:hypothetical protein